MKIQIQHGVNKDNNSFKLYSIKIYEKILKKFISNLYYFKIKNIK